MNEGIGIPHEATEEDDEEEEQPLTVREYKFD